ncbi:MAG: molybdopterin-dependent oxidoreductase, partial [Pseudonocardia sediminis]
ILRAAGVHAGATSLWATGLDSGEFGGVACTEYRKDVPLEVALARGIVALEIDGVPLSAERGYPARLVVPGYFGTNNVKWLRALTVSDRRPEHLFTTRLYLRTVPGTDGPQPVRDLDVNSLVTLPSDGARVGADVEVAGWAWSAVPVVAVEVAVDGEWAPAEVERRRGPHVTWQRFRTVRRAGPGGHTLAVRATDRDGRVQPVDGARNAAHHVTVDVR